MWSLRNIFFPFCLSSCPLSLSHSFCLLFHVCRFRCRLITIFIVLHCNALSTLLLFKCSAFARGFLEIENHCALISSYTRFNVMFQSQTEDRGKDLTAKSNCFCLILVDTFAPQLLPYFESWIFFFVFFPPLYISLIGFCVCNNISFANLVAAF